MVFPVRFTYYNNKNVYISKLLNASLSFRVQKILNGLGLFIGILITITALFNVDIMRKINEDTEGQHGDGI